MQVLTMGHSDEAHRLVTNSRQNYIQSNERQRLVTTRLSLIQAYNKRQTGHQHI